jgi:hypothetical protein
MALVRAPLGLVGGSPDIKTQSGRGEEDREGNIWGENGRNNMRVWREEIRNWPGPGGVLKITGHHPASNLSFLRVLLPSWTGCCMSLLSCWLPGPRLIPTLFLTGPVKVLP